MADVKKPTPKVKGGVVKASQGGASKKNANTAKATKPKKPNIFKRLAKYLREVVAEVKKVTWPTKHEFLTYTLVVFVFVLIMTAIIFTMNTALTAGLNALLNIGA